MPGASGHTPFDNMDDFIKETCYYVDGIVMPNTSPRRYLADLKDFNVRDDDTFLMSYPKTGTTWMQQILLLLRADGDIASVREKHLLHQVPFLELKQNLYSEEGESVPGIYEIAEKMPSPRLMKTHLMPHLLPRTFFEKKPKIVCMARNPKDTAVSYYNFCLYAKILPQYPSWEHFFTGLCQDLTPRGSWFEFTIFWWNKRHDANVLFVTYEEMTQNLKAVVEKVAKFLGKNFDDDVIDSIVKNSSFDTMKSNPNSNPDALPVFTNTRRDRSFMRKGKVGDWKNYFTVAQNEVFNHIYEERITDPELKKLFEY